jgi:hypothetical protein
VDSIHEGIIVEAAEVDATAPEDLVPWAREVAAAMLTGIAGKADDIAIVHLARWPRFDDYLITRVDELVVHSFDLQLSWGLGVEAPVMALAEVYPLLLELEERANPAPWPWHCSDGPSRSPATSLADVRVTTWPGSPPGGAVSPYAGHRPTAGEETCSSP